MTGEKIGLVVPVALKEVMEQLLPEFERETGHGFEIAVMLNPEVPGYIASGATWDVALTNPWHVEEIIVAGHGARGSHRPFGRSPLAFGVRDDAADADDAGSRHRAERDLAATLLGAGSIAVTDTGTSGKTFRRLIERLGIEDAVGPGLRFLGGGEPMAALIAGDVDMAALPLTNIAPVPGVATAAICPMALDVHIDLSLCVNRNASDAARTFADWLIDPARDAVLSRLGAERFTLES